jgi:alkylation response protein AidB-like acyl-CoA dehydrogenase
MQFGLNESQQILQTNARKFFAAECPMTEVRRIAETADGFDPQLWAKIAEQGYTGVIFPEEYGGLGLGLVEFALLIEEAGRALVPGPFLSTLIAAAFVEAGGSPEQKERFLRPVCEGRRRAAYASIEPNPARDISRVEMRGGRTLTGRKIFVPDAASADFLVVLCVDGSYVVPRGSGVTIERMPHLDLTRRMYAVTFDNAPAERLPNKDLARRSVDIARLALAAETVGGMQRVLDMSVEYAKTRKQFGNPIGKYQAVQHMCADSYLETESARSAVYYAAWALQENIPEAATAISVAKMYAGDASRNVGNRGIQIHGGMGFTWESDAHLYYRRFKSNETSFGDPAFHRERIARLVIDARAQEARA